jgi:hypothetical protein
VSATRLYLSFDGFYQMRMATDPDPTDDPRGVSGYTFALAGEPDFDGLLHFQPDEPGVHERRFGVDDSAPGPRVGVTVRSAKVFDDDTLTFSDDPRFADARLALPGARFAELNGIVVRNDFFPIDPVRVQVRATDGTLLLDREDFLNPADPSMPIVEADSDQLARRQPVGFVGDSVSAAKATGLPSSSQQACIDDRRIRQRNLEALLAVTEDPIERAALETRISQLNILRRWWALSQDDGRTIDRRAHQLTLEAFGWSVDVNGTVHANGVGADESRTWPLSFWSGGWDGDALCGYVSGYLDVPLA